MRLILRNRLQCFSTKNKLSSVIESASQSLNEQQKTNFLKYEQLFFKLYTNHIAKQKKVTADIRRIDAMCMLSDFPCKAIIEHFLMTAKTYDEDYVVQTFVRLSRANKISQLDNSSTIDLNINKLFFTPAFDNLIQQFKFGLKKQNAMKWENAFLVAECLVDLGYADYQVFSLLLNMLQKVISKTPRLDHEIRNFQIQKNNYYNQKLRQSHKNLIQDVQLGKVLQMLHKKVKQSQFKSQQQTYLNDLSSQLSNSEQNQTIYLQILQSVKQIQLFNQNLTKMIQGIITIRKQYLKMVQLSSKKQILRNPEINFQLLQLEQTLLMKKFISLSDIKHPQKIKDQQYELRRIQQVLASLVTNNNQQFSLVDITNFINLNLDIPQKKEQIKLQTLREIQQLGRGLAVLARYAELSRRLYHSPDARSLISMKWEKTLLQSTTHLQTPEFRENLHVEKIFRRVYVDLFKMMKRNYNLLVFTFVDTPLKYKIQFFESLARLGLHGQLIHLFANTDTSKVDHFSKNEFTSLIKVLNEVGHSIKAQQLKKGTFKHLKKLFQQSQLQQSKPLFSMQFNINAINFICQNFTVSSVDMTSSSQDQTQNLYEKLIDCLAYQTKYTQETQNFLINDQLYEAYRILSMERSGEFKLDQKFYQRYGVDVKNLKSLNQFLYKKNPFNFIVKEMTQQFQHTSKGKYPFVQTGFNSKGDLTGVMVVGSDHSSIDGNHTTGNLNAYITRVRRDFNINITPLIVNSLIDINFSRINQNKEFSFKSKEIIQALITSLFKKDELNLLQFAKILTNICPIIEKSNKKNQILPFVRFLNNLNEIVKLQDRQKQIFSSALFKFRRHRLFVALDNLKVDYNMFSSQVKEQVEKLYKKQISLLEVSESIKRSNSIINTIENIQNSILKSVENHDNELTQTLFQGKRFSIESFIQNDFAELAKNIGVQFINSTTYFDKAFCNYKQWNEAINHYYSVENVNLKKSSNLTKILARKYLPKAREQLFVLPFAKRSILKNKKQLLTTSLAPLKQAEKEVTQISEQQIEGIKDLLLFIHELKVSKSQRQLVEYIFSFDFISNMMSSNQKQTNQKTGVTNQKLNGILLKRSSEQYLSSLQCQNNSLPSQSSNLSYLFQKLQKTQSLTQLFQSRRSNRSLAKMQYQLGKLNQKQLFQKLQSIDDTIIKQLETLQHNILDNVEGKFLQTGLKMIKVQKDQQELQRVLNRQRYYYRILDRDYVHVKGNTDRTLNIKRTKAERKLALYQILYKLSQAQQLNQNQKNFLKKQASYVSYRLLNSKQHNDVYNEKFTTMTVQELSKEDKQRLKLGGVDLSVHKNLCLSEIILQISRLLQPKLQQNFQKLLYQSHYKPLGMPVQLFTPCHNNQFSSLCNLTQRRLISQNSKLQPYQRNLLNQMIHTFKTQSFTGKQKFLTYYQGLQQDLNQFNQTEIRIELIAEYLNMKEEEFQDGFNPKLVLQRKQKQTHKLWNIIFRKQYIHTDANTIHKVVNLLCQRIRIMGQNSPPFFGNLVLKILEHPQTDILSKQNLIASLEFFKVPLKIDSEDIKLIGYACRAEQRELLPNTQELFKQIGAISNKNFMEDISKKVGLII